MKFQYLKQVIIMANKTKFALLLISLCSVTIFPQKKDEKPKLSQELNKQVIELLQEVPQDIFNLQSPTNRLIYSIETAHLLWKYDEKEAFSLYQNAMNSIKKNLVQMETDSNLPENYDLVPMENSTAKKGNLKLKVNDKTPNLEGQLVKKLDYDFMRKFDSAIKFREPLIESLAENVPILADEFLRETTQIITNDEFKISLNYQNKSLERVVALGIGKKDSTKTLEMGRKLLLHRDLDGMSQFLTEFHKIDSGKATVLAEECLKKLETTEAVSTTIIQLVDAIEKTNTSKDSKPLASESKVRDLIESVATKISNKSTFTYNSPYTIISLLPLIEKYVPTIGMQIRLKYSNDKNPEIAELFKSNKVKLTNDSVSNESDVNDLEKADVQNQKMTNDEKKEILDVLRLELGQAKKSEKPELFFEAAKTLAKAEEKELAISLLEEAKTYSSLQIRNSNDGEFFWNLASIYSSVEPDKSFELLESAIPQLQSLLEAFVIVLPFLESGSEELLVNGECECGFVKSIIEGMPASDETILNLADADFPRLKGFIYKFDRPEIRIALKVVVVKSLLNQK
jgi:hypothetical protein